MKFCVLRRVDGLVPLVYAQQSTPLNALGLCFVRTARAHWYQQGKSYFGVAFVNPFPAYGVI